MLVYVAPAQYRHEKDLLQAIAGTLYRLGHNVTQDRRAPYAAAIVWNGRDWPREVPTLFCECGWLPRWWYQVSHTGINAASHLAPLQLPPGPLSEADRCAVAEHLHYCRTHNPYQWGYVVRSGKLPDGLPERFILCPCQIETDTNMAHVAEQRRTPQGLINNIEAMKPPFPVVFKRHPANHSPKPLTLARPQDMIVSAAACTIADLLDSGRCAAVWTANSNTYHDALCRGIPAVAYDAGIWGARHQTAADADPYPYLLALKQAQWTRETARNPSRVRAALELAISAFPRTVITMTTPTFAHTVNVCVGDRGWLFNDLAKHLEKHGPAAGCNVSVTTTPLTDADAYLYMRADEASQCPHPERAVCQVHDQWGDWHGRFAGAANLGAWSFTHPEQEPMVRKFAGLDGKRTMLCPLGAPAAWVPRKRRDPNTFTVAWVGRAVAFKRLEWFTQAIRHVAQDIPALRVVFLGQNCEPYAAMITQTSGARVEIRTKDSIGFAGYEAQYQSFDAVVICSETEAHPLPLFEAMACGVPVISTRVGYAPWLAPYLYDTAEKLPGVIMEAWHNRDRDWERREWFAIQARQWGTLESWCVQNLKFAMEVAKCR